MKKYTISEAAKVLDYEPHVLRFYESEFNIKVPRDSKNHRQYTRKEIELFQYIKDLKEKGYNNNQIKEILKSPVEETSYGYVDCEDVNLPQRKGESQVKSDLAVQEVAVHLKALNDMVVSNFVQLDETVKELAAAIEEIRQNTFDEDKDVLISENAKLKMKLKEKTYELVEIRERYAKLEQKKFVFKRLFK